MSDCDFLVVTGEFPPFAGGAGAYTVELVRTLEKLNARVVVLGPEYSTAEALDPLHLKSEILPWFPSAGSKPLRLIRAMAHIRSARERFRPTVTILANWNAHRAGAFLDGRGVILLVYGSEALSLLHRPLIRPLFSRVYKEARLLVGCSKFATEMAISLGAPEQCTAVVYPRVAPRFLGPLAETAHISELRSEWGIPPSVPVVVSVGRLVRRKGFDTALRAISQLREKVPGIRYMIAGGGPERDNLEGLVQELGLQHNVAFLGNVTEQQKLRLYDLCNCHVMLSRQVGFEVEGYGITFDEAALRRKPSLGTNHGGVPEAVEDGKTGFIVPSDSVDRAAARLFILLTDHDLRERMGRVARERALNRQREFESRTAQLFFRTPGVR